MGKSVKGWIFFAGIFSVVCIWKLWFGIFMIFAYALSETALRRKRSFCKGTCPIGNVLDFAGKDSEGKARKKPPHAIVAGWIFLSLYVAAILFVLIVFRDSDGLKWFYYFRMMTGSFILAIVADMIFGKRFWCIYMCPLSKAMKGILAIARR